ncbi:alpha/beta-hydrolase [Thelephora ganbajun]|uniref:Alpha/beta-hydrolase n=1 Tax=Thelephora ganbajun TaxID=370292 RepID=A0ACB6Z6E9_THEGA|nr:alpha/beta-hydrolase [Thelephora ganbajun]
MRSLLFISLFLSLRSALAAAIVFKTRSIDVWRPRNYTAVSDARTASAIQEKCHRLQWDRLSVKAPDVTDQYTLAQLGRMAANAYALPGAPNWWNLDPIWSSSFPIGWENPIDGFRGHVFVNPDNTTVVLSIKGTTLNGPTSKADKLNDNLMFSCCCARVDFTWVFRTVCDCYAKHSRCDNTCLSESLVKDSLFYNTGLDLIGNITTLFPDSDIWLVGHSLGGALASLLGTTYGLPAVAFESPGERLASTRLDIPIPPEIITTGNYSLAPVTHIYHTADPIPQGTCTGRASPCAQAGYALETRCHLGTSIVYDTVGRLKWSVDIRTHPIKEVINRILEQEIWWEFGRQVPRARAEEDCADCDQWEFGDYLPPAENTTFVVQKILE